jgi:hypothetical protein
MTLNHLLAGVVLWLVAAPSIARADCLDDAAAFHRVNVVLVRAIAQQESGMRANAINVNRDGSEDIGLMQINRNLLGCYVWIPYCNRCACSDFLACERLFR